MVYIIQPASVPESTAVFLSEQFVNASHRGSGEEEGQGDENRARFMTSEDTQKHAKLPLVRKWRGWYKKTPESERQGLMAGPLCGEYKAEDVRDFW